MPLYQIYNDAKNLVKRLNNLNVLGEEDGDGNISKYLFGVELNPEFQNKIDAGKRTSAVITRRLGIRIYVIKEGGESPIANCYVTFYIKKDERNKEYTVGYINWVDSEIQGSNLGVIVFNLILYLAITNNVLELELVNVTNNSGRAAKGIYKLFAVDTRQLSLKDTTLAQFFAQPLQLQLEAVDNEMRYKLDRSSLSVWKKNFNQILNKLDGRPWKGKSAVRTLGPIFNIKFPTQRSTQHSTRHSAHNSTRHSAHNSTRHSAHNSTRHSAHRSKQSGVNRSGRGIRKTSRLGMIEEN